MCGKREFDIQRRQILLKEKKAHRNPKDILAHKKKQKKQNGR